MTNRTATRKNLIRKRKIASEDLPISIPLLTNSTEEENDNEKRAHCSLSSKPNLKTRQWRIDRIFYNAWIKYQVYGKTNLLDRYTSGFILAQLSVKQGIKKYGI